MGKIILKDLEFFAYHGYYAHEKEKGNRFGVDLCVEVDFEKAAIDDSLPDTVSYEELFRIANEEMLKPCNLLEHLAANILDRIMEEKPSVSKAKATVKKFNPPIGGKASYAAVKLKRTRY